MKIVWDDKKQKSNIKKHGYDFAELDMFFFEHSTFRPTREGRFKAIGLFKDRMVSVIFRPLGREALMVISMRVANIREYQK